MNGLLGLSRLDWTLFGFSCCLARKIVDPSSSLRSLLPLHDLTINLLESLSSASGHVHRMRKLSLQLVDQSGPQFQANVWQSRPRSPQECVSSLFPKRNLPLIYNAIPSTLAVRARRSIIKLRATEHNLP